MQQNRISLREALHRQGVQALREGDYVTSLRLLSEGLDLYGPHVGLLSDLAGAAYLNGDMALFEAHVNRLKAEYALARELLSKNSQVLTVLAIAKFDEELGLVADALSGMNSIFGKLHASETLTLRVQMQRLRLLTWLERNDEIAEAYRLCLGISQSQPQLYIEAYHALCLAEYRLFGFELAWTRFTEVSIRTDLQAADLGLCVFDLLEIAIERQDKHAEAVLLMFVHEQALGHEDTYERSLLKLVSGDSVTSADLLRWTQLLSPMGRLRVTALALQMNTSADPAGLRKHLLLQLQAVDHRSRSLLMAKWPQLLKDDQRLTVELSVAELHLQFEGRTLSLAQSPQSFRLLAMIARTGDGTEPVELLKTLGRSAGGAQDLESLRILLLRLNRKLSSFLGIDYVVRFRKDQIVLNPRLQWKEAVIAEEADL